MRYNLSFFYLIHLIKRKKKRNPNIYHKHFLWSVFASQYMQRNSQIITITEKVEPILHSRKHRNVTAVGESIQGIVYKSYRIFWKDFLFLKLKLNNKAGAKKPVRLICLILFTVLFATDVVRKSFEERMMSVARGEKTSWE